MSGITLHTIINDENIKSQYSNLVTKINEEINLNHGKYYIYDIFQIGLDREITLELLDQAEQKMNDFITKKNIIPFARKPDLANIKVIKTNFENLKKIIQNYELEKNNCCFAQPKEEIIQGAGSGYIFYDKMDEPNKKMMDICATQGMDGMVKAIVAEMKDKKLSYSEMRERYG